MINIIITCFFDQSQSAPLLNSIPIDGAFTPLVSSETDSSSPFALCQASGISGRMDFDFPGARMRDFDEDHIDGNIEDTSQTPHFVVPRLPGAGAFAEPATLGWRLKQLAEPAVAAMMIATTLPVMLLIALAIVMESKGPVLFLQPRFGRSHRSFNVLKFRTMRSECCDVTGADQTADTDARITRVGQVLRKTSLDELPQLFNVLFGQMSLVGPRAHPCGMQVEGKYCAELVPTYHLRHMVKPGITGWAQVNGSRGAVKNRQMLLRRVALDLHYIQNWSLLLELRILVQTVTVVIRGELAR